MYYAASVCNTQGGLEAHTHSVIGGVRAFLHGSAFTGIAKEPHVAVASGAGAISTVGPGAEAEVLVPHHPSVTERVITLASHTLYIRQEHISSHFIRKLGLLIKHGYHYNIVLCSAVVFTVAPFLQLQTPQMQEPLSVLVHSTSFGPSLLWKWINVIMGMETR